VAGAAATRLGLRVSDLMLTSAALTSTNPSVRPPVQGFRRRAQAEAQLELFPELVGRRRG
jgi:hypothetical protein